MTLEIEKDAHGRRIVIHLSGKLRSEHLDQLRAEIKSHPSRAALNLDAVSLVDGEAARFLNACEENGVELVNCWPYIREWMLREQPENSTAWNCK